MYTFEELEKAKKDIDSLADSYSKSAITGDRFSSPSKSDFLQLLTAVTTTNRLLIELIERVKDFTTKMELK